MTLQVRLPQGLHAAIKGEALEDDRSLNAMIVRLLREALTARHPSAPDRPAE